MGHLGTQKVEAEAQAENPTLAVGQRIQDIHDFLAKERIGSHVVRIICTLILNKVPKVGIVTVTDRTLQGNWLLGHFHDLLDTLTDSPNLPLVIFLTDGAVGNERELMQLFAVGRPAGRDAMSALAQIGLIDLQPGETFLAVAHPGQFDGLIPQLRYEVMKAGAIDLGVMDVLAEPVPESWSEDVLRSGGRAAQEALRIKAGVPRAGRELTGSEFPQEARLEGAVSFDKGCYPGQEIVARTHYRGATKRRTHRFRAARPVSPGDKITDGERDVGEVLNAIGTDLLAVIPSEKADEALGVAGAALEHIPLAYA